MDKMRLEIFSDAVIAIAMTIMVIELKPPEGANLAALTPLLPTFLAYVMSYMYLAIYWNNHHHMLHATDHIDGLIMWANLHLLFWLSLVPFATAWMAENDFAPLATGAYGILLFLSSIAFYLLQSSILAHCDANNALREAIEHKWKERISMLMYLCAIPIAFWYPMIAIALYVVVALLWLIPDRRIEARVHKHSRT